MFYISRNFPLKFQRMLTLICFVLFRFIRRDNNGCEDMPYLQRQTKSNEKSVFPGLHMSQEGQGQVQ